MPPRFYIPFAEFLRDAGLAVRIAAPTSPRLGDWVSDDLPRALDSLPRPRVWIGHSMGGQLFGLMRDPQVDRALLVAAQHGHWRNWPAPERYAMAALWWGAIPIVARAFGKIWMPGGARVPGTIARTWARWGRSRDYLLQDKDGATAFDTFTGPIVSYAIADDRYAPITTVRPLAQAFTRTRVDVRTIDRGGHFGVFRRQPVWDEWLAWITA